MSDSAALLSAVRRAIGATGDPERALRQRAYMRSDLPFQGLPAPELRALLRPILDEHRVQSRQEWVAAARALWDEASVREHRYGALAVLRRRAYRSWVGPDLLPELRHLVVTGAWWDLVDEIAAHLVGPVLADSRERTTPVVRAWARADDLWLRRTAVLSQLTHKHRTDTDLLADVLTVNLEGSPHGSDFFIRKAVGWALRERARIDPDWVRAYVEEHGARLSPLSRREALKHLDGATKAPQTGTSSTAPTA